MSGSQLLILRQFLLATVLPSVVFPLLVALVAALGINRWRRALLWLSIIGLILFIISALLLRIQFANLGVRFPTTVISLLDMVVSPAVSVSFILNEIGAIIALTLATRSHSWAWFINLLIATLISSGAGLFAFSPYALIVFGNYSQSQSVFYQPLYVLITVVPAGLSLLAQLLYALIGPQTATTATPVASSDAVTLP